MMNRKEAVLRVIYAIPRGRVATYGQVARLAGLGRAARYVGTTLRNLPPGSQLPWHRVINGQGKISLPVNSEGYLRQKQRLEAEDIEFRGERVDLRKFAWRDDT